MRAYTELCRQKTDLWISGALNSYKIVYSGFCWSHNYLSKSLKTMVGAPRLELGTSCV